MEEEKKAPPPKRTRYMSCNMDEFERLRELGFQERWLYLELKWLANFKTGLGGRFGKQRLSFETLAELMSRAAVQGLTPQPLDRSTVRRLLLRLEAAELVAEIGRREDNGGLTFRLPRSPIKAGGKLPQEERTKSPASAESARDFCVSEDSLSVLINPKRINTPFITESASEENWGASLEEDDTRATPPPEESQTSGRLTLSYLMKRLEAAHFDYVGSAQSRTLYARWLRDGVTREQFERALSGVMHDLTVRQSPDSIEDRLRGWRRRVIERHARGHGRVAL